MISPAAEYLRKMHVWTNPGFDCSDEMEQRKFRIAELFGTTDPAAYTLASLPAQRIHGLHQ